MNLNDYIISYDFIPVHSRNCISSIEYCLMDDIMGRSNRGK